MMHNLFRGYVCSLALTPPTTRLRNQQLAPLDGRSLYSSTEYIDGSLADWPLMRSLFVRVYRSRSRHGVIRPRKRFNYLRYTRIPINSSNCRINTFL